MIYYMDMMLTMYKTVKINNKLMNYMRKLDLIMFQK